MDDAAPTAIPPVSEITTKRHDVFDSADLLVRLLISEVDLGYKLVTYYTASATIYVAIVGLTAQQYFAALRQGDANASTVAWLGFALSLLSLAAPFGLDLCRKESEARAAKYAEALGLPPERFSVIRFGTWLSFAAFGLITAGWTYLVAIR